MDRFVQQVSAYITGHGLLPNGCPVIAGVSGGADSLALLLILVQLRQPLGFTLSAAHLNHGLRGAAADEDEAFVRDWCLKLDVPFFSCRIDVAAFGDELGIGLEDAGRRARQAFFADLAARVESPVPARIALAHHLDDQAETVLLHLGRGSGLDGLVGIMPQNGRLVRPLLGQSRRSIEQWLAGQGIEWRHDASNDETLALRNRIRHQVLPVWQDALGYDPAPLIVRTAASLDEDRLYLTRMASEAVFKCRAGEGLSQDALLQLDPAMQNRVLRLFWQERTGSSRDLSFTHVGILRGWLAQAQGGQRISLPGGWQARLFKAVVHLENIGADAGQTAGLAGQLQEIQLVLPGVTCIPEFNLQIVALLIENESEIVYNSAVEYFRLDRIKGCVVRRRLPGDRIHPHGRSGGKSLKKYFNEQGIPADRRDTLPYLALDHEIVWLPGHTAGRDFAGRPGDGRPGPLVRLEVRKLEAFL